MNYKLIHSAAIFEVRSQYGYSQRPIRMSAKQMSLYSLSSLTKKTKSSCVNTNSINNTLRSNNRLLVGSAYDLNSLCSVNCGHGTASTAPSPNLIHPVRKILVDSVLDNNNNKSNNNNNNGYNTDTDTDGDGDDSNINTNSSKNISDRDDDVVVVVEYIK